MKKIIIAVILIGAIVTSCSNNGKKAATKDAEKVEVVKTNTTTVFTKLKNGSFLDWRASHFGGAQPRFGKIYYSDAKILINNGELTNVTVAINMSTLTVESFPKGAEEIGKLTGHLKSADFFNIEKYPTSKFELTNLEKITGDYSSKLTGNLTILDVTKSITFSANVTISENEVSIQSEDFSINRTDWGLKYNVEGSEGVPVDYIIANDIGFTIHTILTR